MYPLLLSVALLSPAQPPKVDPNPNDIGVLPLGADGKPLNLDFETGTLKDWTAEGEAFKGQPIKGDTVHPRRADNRSRHQGQFWIGGYEKLQDKPVGTLTSVPFKVTHPWASFLVGGGPHPKETYVEIVSGKDVIFTTPGREMEDMERAVIDLAKCQGKEIFIRIVDKHTGHWGHINFDDFRFHEKKPNFPARPKVEPPPPVDVYKHAGLKPLDAAKAMTVPNGFSVSVFAGEPDVHQPIAFCIDHRGRLWVVEAYTYPRRHAEKGPIIPVKDGEPPPGDKIVIFEDADGDGKFDKRTVFMEGLNLASGIEVGFGGVWVGAAPYLLFIPHDEKTDKPAGEPKILLDGWGWQDTHETLNSFIWGPDGWLYGCHGVFTHSVVGKPGAEEKDRTKINAGIWRYHPTKHVFEVFAHGTSNPWGLDYNANGDFFIEACVIPHMWHIIQGGRYARQAGSHFNPYTYDDIKTIAVHRHYVGATPHGGNNRSDSAGGGHAHAGLMCYQGGTWPKEYHGKLFMGNLHGHRINVDVITPKGSGYVADRNPDFLLTNDKWSIPLAFKSGPDGNVYMLDWYDKQICHLPQPEKWDRTNGRIYKISHKDTKPVKNVDLSKATDEELVKYQLHENDWYARTARRLLQERAANTRANEKGIDSKADQLLRSIVKGLVLEGQNESNPVHRLRALWALHVTKGLDWGYIITASSMRDDSSHIRGWTHRLTDENDKAPSLWFTTVYKEKHTAVERRFIASLLQMGGVPQKSDDKLKVIAELLSHPEDATDHNLPYLYWYALEPLCAEDPAKALKIASEGKIPLLLQFAARRVGSLGTPEVFDLLTKSLAEAKTDAERVAYFRGLQEGARGKRNLPTPKDWTAAFEVLMKSPDATVRQQALGLAVTFGDKNALVTLRKVLADTKADPATRLAALTALVEGKDTETAKLLHAVLGEKELRTAALRGLAAFDDPKTPAAILAEYGNFTLADKRDALATLAARPAYAKELMNAIAAKKIPASDVPAEIIRQLRGYNDAALDKQIADLWGVVRETPAEKKQLITAWKKRLTASTAPPGDVNLGRTVYAKTCQQCHILYGVGGKVGPEITGANRGSIDYLLENILDPSAVIPKEYAATRIVTTDDRNIVGIVKGEANGVLTIQTDREVLTIAVADIASRKPSDLSMMPDDILKQVGEAEFRALIAYLQTQGQVPMLASADNAKEFFNGKDLTGWDGDPGLWKIEGGEIVGKSPGLKKNTFLKSQIAVENFKLSLKVKLTPNAGNSGIQFRSVPLPDGEMKGPQADIGAGWWGKLYEESGRGLLEKVGGEKFVKPDEWNDYVVEAAGDHVKIWINGNLCCDLEDDKLARRGIIGLQLHSGGAFEVRFKDIKLEVLK